MGDCEESSVSPLCLYHLLLRTDCALRFLIRYYTIRGMNECVASYIWDSTMAPDLSEGQGSLALNEACKDRSPVLLFMIWPQEQDTQIWIYIPEVGWEVVKVGDGFVNNAGRWRREKEGSGEYVLTLGEPAHAKLIKKNTYARSGMGTEDSSAVEHPIR